MPAPLVGGLLWGLGSLIGMFATRLYDFLIKFMAEKWAYRALIGTAFVVAVGGITVSMAAAVKGIVIAARVSMPSSLGASTYFLPTNINYIIAAYITARLTVYVYEWTLKNMERWFMAGS